MFKKKPVFYIKFILFFIFILTFLYIVNRPYKVEINYNNLDLNNVNKIMIVAHPDDETIWGGGHLIEDNYLVVCVTCGSNKIRTYEFKKVMKITKDNYIMLGYPDKRNGKLDNWVTIEDNIFHDLEYLIDMKHWQDIVTHNPNGEYGHYHHKKISDIVTYLAAPDQLYYFGTYYSKRSYDKLQTPLLRLNDETYEIKVEKLIEVYKTQRFIKKTFSQMFPHENWIRSTDWN
ncbi:MAG: PIG-L family deacetylase [Bacilli bacterium]|nr:PIG-L family deacetylase [Bacilli bacterium]MDD4733747.1 PIG-L family deacetylase [Bacilli bacterium]